MTLNGGQDSDALMRSEIHQLGILLGHSLTRQEGPQLFELVEKIRTLSKDKPNEVAQLLAHIDLDSAIKLARAFSVYFHLANITEQFFRSQDRAKERTLNGTWLAQVASRIKAAGIKNRETIALAHLSVLFIFFDIPFITIYLYIKKLN